MDPLEYREETPDGFSEALARTWSVVQVGDAVRMNGDCPTCGHPSASELERIRATLSTGTRLPVSVICDCGELHPGRPDGKRGCGRAGMVEVELDA